MPVVVCKAAAARPACRQATTIIRARQIESGSRSKLAGAVSGRDPPCSRAARGKARRAGRPFPPWRAGIFGNIPIGIEEIDGATFMDDFGEFQIIRLFFLSDFHKLASASSPQDPAMATFSESRCPASHREARSRSAAVSACPVSNVSSATCAPAAVRTATSRSVRAAGMT